MNVFGLTIARTKNLAPPAGLMPPLSPRGGGWWPIIRESFTGAWQRNIAITAEDIGLQSVVWSCMTMIASDFAKIWIDLVEHLDGGISMPTENSAYSPVLRSPNHFSTRVKFFEYWQLSKLQWGNTYVLKARNNRGSANAGNVTDLYVLDPQRVQVLVAPNGDVYYQCQTDYLANLTKDVIVPASEIIHDIAVPLHHPLIGVSPIMAAWLTATQALNIQKNTSNLFGRGSILSGVISTPHEIPQEVADRIQKHWEAEYSGPENVGKVAVLGNDLKFEPMVMTAVNAQLIEQLRWTAEQICACFHVPPYLVGIGAAPPYTDLESLLLQYYQQALQNPIENAEELLEKGLELPSNLGIEFDVDALHRMNTKTLVDTAVAEVRGGLATPNEGRAIRNRKPIAGGNTIYLQQQDIPIEVAAENARPTPAPTPSPSDVADTTDTADITAQDLIGDVLRRWAA